MKLIHWLLVTLGLSNRPMRFRLRCRLRLHRWSIWSTPEVVDYTTKEDYGGISVKTSSSAIEVQGRSCKDCGMTDKRLVKPRAK